MLKKATAQEWFMELLNKFENDKDYQREKIIFELEEKFAHSEKAVDVLDKIKKVVEEAPSIRGMFIIKDILKDYDEATK